MGVKETYENDIKTRLTALDAQITDLAGKIDNAGGDAQVEYRQTLTRLKRKREEIQTRFVALENAGESAWSELSSGFNEALAVFSQSVDDAQTRFKAEHKEMTA